MVAVYFIDLDLFKQVNDQFGHEVGDAALKCVSDRLRGLLRAADTVGRLSGDEFVIIASGVRSAEDAESLAQKIVDSFRPRLDIPGHDITIGASVGVSLYPLDEGDAEALLRHADSAMYSAKQAGGLCYRMFSADIDPERRRRLDLEREIHAAVALNQFRMIVLGVADAQGRARAGLVDFYWEHPRFGRVASDETLRAATRASLLGDLELWLICNACSQMHAAAAAGLPALPLIVGISGWQLRDASFSDYLQHLLKRFEVPPRRLVLSMSRDGLSEAATAPAERLAQLVKLGLRFALRDFDGGFEILSRQLPISLDLILLSEDLPERALQDGDAARRLRIILETAATTGRKAIARGVTGAQSRRQLEGLGPVLIAGSMDQAMADAQSLFRLPSEPL
jgi:diguanylate cyclase (GGDEF)-like protein